MSLIVATVAPPYAIAQQAPAPVERSVAKVQALDAQLAELAEALPRRTWDVDDLALDLAFEEPEAIVAWVRDRVRFEPYAGLLRGPNGTLLAGAANAVDQSVLLARLLNDAGYEARLARATLEESQARRLLGNAAPAEAATRSAEPAPNRDPVWRFLDALGGSRGGVEDALARARANVAALRDEADEASTWLLGRLDDAGVELGAGDAAELIEESRDYVWVQYRLSEAAPWSAAHPALTADAAWAAELEAEQILEGSVPADLMHRFRFRAVVERKRGDELQVAPLMSPWERPVANLAGLALTYASVADGFAADDGTLRTPEEAAGETRFVAPMFNDALADGGQLFDMRGSTVPPDAAASPAAGIFQEVGGAFAEATGEISGDEDAATLTAHWLEFTFIAPSGEETTHRRMIVDRLGPERRRSGDVRGELAPLSDTELHQRLQATHTFMVSSGRFPAAYLESKTIDAVRGTLGYLESALVGSASEDATVAEPPAEAGAQARNVPLLQLFGAFEDGLSKGVGNASYRHEPGLAVVSNAWDGSMSRTDVVANPRRTLREPAARDAASDARATVRAGAWETASERLFLGDGPNVVDTFSYFRSVREAGGEAVVVGPEQTDALEEVRAPPDALAAMRRDVERGYVVVASAAPPEDATNYAWWRVDPATGETLGRGGDGRGQAAEYSTTQLLVAGVTISAFWGTAGFATCMGTGGRAGCCFADAATGFAIGFVGGLVLTWLGASAAVGIGVGFGFDFVSTNVGMADGLGLADLIPSWCDGATNVPPTMPGTAVAAAAACRLPAPRVVAGPALPSTVSVATSVGTG